MSSAPLSIPGAAASQASNDSASPTDVLSEEELLAHVLSGARERVRAAVERLTAMGIIDENGTVLTQELPRDMRPDSQTTVVTG
ncbi:MAG: hypothetical protein IPL19_06505 [Sandaracinaceae bacterium]|nr:hypothetical protein [Sandaracinaceae bacterium]MBK7151295.1 hypothetical protein [Sandaracinaceae bacterium]MBK8407623.1 hypothetical protein [Sandaracinaceae bacterium]